jgi:hypothetical protein
MAAWRGRRALTWITGVVAFVGSIGTAFTGYLVQQNFDSQWIAPDAGQKLGPLPLQRWGGVREPVDTANDFVLDPLRAVPHDATLTAALTTYTAAAADQQNTWASGYADTLSKAPDGDPAKVPAGDYGPVPTLAGRLLDLAGSGGLDGALTSEHSQIYASDYTKPLLFLADGSYLEDRPPACPARRCSLGLDEHVRRDHVTPAGCSPLPCDSSFHRSPVTFNMRHSDVRLPATCSEARSYSPSSCSSAGKLPGSMSHRRVPMTVCRVLPRSSRQLYFALPFGTLRDPAAHLAVPP